MKKFFLTLVSIFALSSTCLAATQVRVSDYNLNEFFNAYNRVATVMKVWTFDEFPKKVMESDIYDTYMASCGPNGHGVIVGFFVNKEGHVSKITLSFKGYDQIACDCLGMVFPNVLVTLGVNVQKLETLYPQLENKNSQFVVPCSALKRFIVIDVLNDASGLTTLRLIGSVK